MCGENTTCSIPQNHQQEHIFRRSKTSGSSREVEKPERLNRPVFRDLGAFWEQQCRHGVGSGRVGVYPITCAARPPRLPRPRIFLGLLWIEAGFFAALKSPYTVSTKRFLMPCAETIKYHFFHEFVFCAIQSDVLIGIGCAKAHK